MRNTLAADFSSAALKAKSQWNNVFTFLMEKCCAQNSIASQTVKSQVKMKTFSEHASFQKVCTSFAPFLSKHLEKVLQQNEDENQERRRNRIQKTMDLTQDVSPQSDTYPTGCLMLE